MARPPLAHARWRVRPSRSQRAVGARDQAFGLQLAEFTDRTGITVEFMPDEAQAPLNFELDEPNRRPDVVRRRRDPGMGRGPRDSDISRFIDPETLRSDFGEYLLSAGTTAGVGGALARGCPGLGDPSDVGLKDLVFYPEGRVPRGRVRDPDHVGRARRAVSSDRG